MLRETLLLTKIQLMELGGLNAAIHSKDSKAKKNAFSYCFAILVMGVVFAGYMAGISMALCSAGGANAIIPLIFIVASTLVFILSVFGSGNTIFNINAYEREIVLPVKPTAIVVSRFIVLYIFEMLIAASVMVPGIIVYSLFAETSALFYVTTILGIILTPLIPLTIASILGTLVLAISSRLPHKNFASIILSIVFIVAFVCIVYPFIFANDITPDVIANISSVIIEFAETFYPVTSLFIQGVAGNLLSYLVFALLSIAIFFAFVAVVQWKFNAISRALVATSAKHNYVMQNQSTTKPFKALYRMELKRYMSSRVYVVNTLTGYILMVIFAVAILVIGTEKISSIPFGAILLGAIPIVLTYLCAITSTTASAISMEGKQWWITQSLPVTTKMVFDSKILVNLTIAVPFYLVSVIILRLAIPMHIVDFMILLLLPISVIIFMAVLGIYENARHPIFDWDLDTKVVKQSGATMITMLIGFALLAVISIAYAVVVFASVTPAILFAIVLVILILSAVIYFRCNKMVLNKIV